jgi:hypothetical protein
MKIVSLFERQLRALHQAVESWRTNSRKRMAFKIQMGFVWPREDQFH